MAMFKLTICIFYLSFCNGLEVLQDVENTDSVDAKLEILLGRIEHLEMNDYKNSHRIVELEKMIASLTNDFTIKEEYLKSEKDELKLKHKKCVKDNSMGDRVKDVHNKIEMHSKEEAKNENSYKDRNVPIQKYRPRRHHASRNVAFFAVATTHDIRNLGKAQNIVFDKEITDIGYSYHNTAGLFSAPVAGTYIFFVTLSGINDNLAVYAYFDVNGAHIVELKVNHYEQSSQTVIIELNAGDDVSIKNDNAGNSYLGATYSSFAGFLLFQDDGLQEVIG